MNPNAKVILYVSESESYPVYTLWDDPALSYEIRLTQLELEYIRTTEKQYEIMQEFIKSKMKPNKQ